MISRDMTEEERNSYCLKVVQEQEASGQTINRWCKEHGISRSRFYRYKKYAQQALSQRDEVPADASEPRLQAAEGKCLTLDAAGIRITLQADADEEMVCKVIRALQSL